MSHNLTKWDWKTVGVTVVLMLALVGCAIPDFEDALDDFYPTEAQDDAIDEAFAAFERGDYEAAHRIWKPFAEDGDAIAQYNLGAMYDYGQGVPHD